MIFAQGKDPMILNIECFILFIHTRKLHGMSVQIVLNKSVLSLGHVYILVRIVSQNPLLAVKGD